MKWNHVNWESQTLQIPETKTDTPRTIPLSVAAIESLKVPKEVQLTQLVCHPPQGSTPESLRELSKHLDGPVCVGIATPQHLSGIQKSLQASWDRGSTLP